MNLSCHYKSFLLSHRTDFICRKLEESSESLEGLIEKIKILNQRRLKERIGLEIDTIQAHVEWKNELNFPSQVKKLSNELTSNAAKYPYIQLGILKNNWRNIIFNRKKMNLMANVNTEENIKLQIEDTNLRRKVFIDTEALNREKAQFYSKNISTFETIIEDTNAKSNLSFQEIKNSESLKFKQGKIILIQNQYFRISNQS